MLTPTALSEDRREYVCARCREVIPPGCYVLGAEKRGKLVGVSAWQDGTCDDGKPGLVAVHACGEFPQMNDPTAQHHATLRGEAPNLGVS